MKLLPTLTAAGFWLFAIAGANAATAPPTTPTTTIPFGSNATAPANASTGGITFASTARTYQPIQLKWQTVTLKEADFQKLITRSNSNQDALAAMLIKSGAEKISTVSIRSYDNGNATIAETSDVPYDTTNPTTQQPETDFILTGVTATIQPRITSHNLVSASVKLTETEAPASSDMPGAPPTTKQLAIQTMLTLSSGHPVLVNNSPDVSSGVVRLYVLTVSLIPYDLVPSR